MAEKKKKDSKKSAPRSKLTVLSQAGKKVGEVSLDPFIFDGKVNQALMHQAVVTYLANQRKGQACVKTRGKVSGGGKKPWRQKGTGRARVGSSRSPLWRGGGVTFGPQPRSYHKDFPKKMKAQALKSALNAKLEGDQIVILEGLEISSPKTKDFAKVLGALGLNQDRVRLILGSLDSNIKLASRNLKKVELVRASSLTTYQVLDCQKLILAKPALQEVEERLKKRLQ